MQNAHPRVRRVGGAEGYMKSENVTRTFTILPGDMNGDGELTIDDVTKLVNKVLKKSQE